MKNTNKMVKSFQSKNFRIGGYSVLVTGIVVAIAILINLLVSKLPATWTKLDASELKIYSVSEQTQEIVKGVNIPIQVYLIAENGREDTMIQGLLERYVALNNQIKVTLIDPVIRLGFTQKYTTETLSSNSLIVESEKRYQVVKYDEIFVTEPSISESGQYEEHVVFNGENRFTSAIDYVTSDSIPTIYSLTGHGEVAFSEQTTSAIQGENIDLKPFSFLTETAIPENANGLLIHAPTSDITVEEAEKIMDYLKKGGNLLLFTNDAPVDMPNLSSLTHYYGTQLAKGVILEGDANGYIPNYPYYLLPTMQSHAITDPLLENSTYVVFPMAHGIEKMETIPEDVTITALFTTSAKAYAKLIDETTSTLEKNSDDAKGPFSVGIAATKTMDENTSNFVWYSTSQITDDTANQIVAGGNRNLLLNTLGWMCEKDTSITIRPIDMRIASLVMTDLESTMWSMILMVVIPAAILLFGFVVWFKRRKK